MVPAKYLCCYRGDYGRLFQFPCKWRYITLVARQLALFEFAGSFKNDNCNNPFFHFALVSPSVVFIFPFGFSAVEGRILELHSPDGVHECWLRATDNTEANVWFNALHSALAALTLKALRLASALPDPQQLQHIGWLARRHCLQVREVSEHPPKEFYA